MHGVSWKSWFGRHETYLFRVKGADDHLVHLKRLVVRIIFVVSIFLAVHSFSFALDALHDFCELRDCLRIVFFIVLALALFWRPRLFTQPLFPALLLWILATLADSGILVYSRYVRTLPRSERGLALADRFLLDPLTYQQRPVELDNLRRSASGRVTSDGDTIWDQPAEVPRLSSEELKAERAGHGKSTRWRGLS